MKKQSRKVYRSIGQIKADLFPNRVKREFIEQLKKDPKKYGEYLADQAIDKLLEEQGRAKKTS